MRNFLNFLYFCINVIIYFRRFLQHLNSNPLSFQCSQPLYIPLHFSFSSLQHRFMKRAGQKRSIQNSLFSRLPISQRVEMIALMPLKACLKFINYQVCQKSAPYFNAITNTKKNCLYWHKFYRLYSCN